MGCRGERGPYNRRRSWDVVASGALIMGADHGMSWPAGPLSWEEIMGCRGERGPYDGRRSWYIVSSGALMMG